MIYTTGNTIVDALGEVHIAGNIIPHTWYKEILRDNGKPYLNAIIILSDIVYWYRPVEIRDEFSGGIIGMRKRFRGEYLQRNYQQMADQFGISKKEAKNALLKLESLGVVKRKLDVVMKGGFVVSNVMYLILDPVKLKELTFPKADPAPETAQRNLPEEKEEKKEDKEQEVENKSLEKSRQKHEKIESSEGEQLGQEKKQELPVQQNQASNEKIEEQNLIGDLQPMGSRNDTPIPKRTGVSFLDPYPQKDTGVSPKRHTYTENTTKIIYTVGVYQNKIYKGNLLLEEYQKLCRKYGKELVDEKVEHSLLYQCCTNYNTIARWCREDSKKMYCSKKQTPVNHNSFNNFHQRSYDFAELERLLLST